jgi:uncharacterized membrane protein YcaP (DUF421 family)
MAHTVAASAVRLTIMHALFHTDLPAWVLIVRATAVFVGVLFMLRLAGKRQVSQLGMPDFVALLLISNAVQNAMNGGDNSLVGGLLMALVLIVLSVAFQYATFRSAKLERIVQGAPTLLIHHGEVIDANLKRELLSRRELHAMLRKQGVQDVSEVVEAVLESDGFVSVIKKGETIPSGVRADIFDECETANQKQSSS